MDWIREGLVFPQAAGDEADCVRQWRPWVLEDENGALRMWYAGHDGTSSRLIEAIKEPGHPWQRLGVVLDPGAAGDTDNYGVESPCVVKTPGGYLMTYAGFDGEITRLHMAASEDGHVWNVLGTFMQRGEEDALGASHPCLLIAGERWWLLYSGYDGSDGGRRAVVLAATSRNGASWDRLGTVLEPIPGEVAVTHPCALEHERRLYLFFASDEDKRVSMALATSTNGLDWERRGVTLTPTGMGPDGSAVHAPCVVRLRDGSLHVWYSGLPVGDAQLAYRICSARFPGSLMP